MLFSHFYTPTLAVFRKISDRFRLSQNFEKRDFIMFPLTISPIQTAILSKILKKII